MICSLIPVLIKAFTLGTMGNLTLTFRNYGRLQEAKELGITVLKH